MIMSSCSLKWRPATKCSWHTNINQSIQYCDIWRNFHPLHEENSKNEEGKPHLFLALVLVSLAGLPWGCGPTIKRNQKQIQIIIWWWDKQACLTNSCLALLTLISFASLPLLSCGRSTVLLSTHMFHLYVQPQIGFSPCVAGLKKMGVQGTVHCAMNIVQLVVLISRTNQE